MPFSGSSRTTRDAEFPFSGPPSRQAGPLSSVSSQASSRPEPSNTAAAAKAAAIGSRRPRKGPRLLTCPDSPLHPFARYAGGEVREGTHGWKPHLPRGGRWEVFGKRAGPPALPEGGIVHKPQMSTNANTNENGEGDGDGKGRPGRAALRSLGAGVSRRGSP